MNGYRYFMKNANLRFLILFLIFGFSYQVYAKPGCPPFVESSTDAEGGVSKIGKGFWSFISGQWGNLNFDPHLLKEIKVTAIKDQGINGYFNPKIQVCDYERNNCYQLHNKTSCQKIYGTQGSGAGVSAAVFIDWEGSKTSIGAQIGEGLEWEWADGVTNEEKEKFAKSPKICACSQKGACMDETSSWVSRVAKGANIFRPGSMENVCDTCYQTKVKCAPVPLAPSPPPFCEQLEMSPPQVRVVPITNKNNDYFNPKVKVIIGDLKREKKEGEKETFGEELDFPNAYGESKAKEHSIKNEKDGTTYYFETYREKDTLCAQYYGTETAKSNRKSQFSSARCFPAPPVPQPEIIKINPNENTLEIKMKMSKDTCRTYGSYKGGFCTFNIRYSSDDTPVSPSVGPLSLKAVKPKLGKKTVDGGNEKSEFDDLLDKILRSNAQFKILEKYGFVPDIKVRCSSIGVFYTLKDFKEELKKGSIKCEFDNSGQPKIEVKYEDNPAGKMLCISGWKPEPEEFILERDSKIISLKSIGASYAKHVTVYSEESKQSYYLPCDKVVDLLEDKTEDELNEIVFNNEGYISIAKENKGRDFCYSEKDDEVKAKADCQKCRVVYKLIDSEYQEECKQGDDGCICGSGKCNRSTNYKNKKDDKYFYLRVSQKSDGTVEKLEVPTKTDRTEVFYADKLCALNLGELNKELLEKIKEHLRREKRRQENTDLKPYTDPGNYIYDKVDLLKYDYVEIEAWGGGEAGHIKGEAKSRESRPGRPGDYVKAKLKIDPDYPIIKVEIREGGGNREEIDTDKQGRETSVKICDSSGEDCKLLMKVAGGGMLFGTRIVAEDLKLEEPTIIRGVKSTIECSSGSNSGKPGAGGCIDKSNGSYSKGSPGAVIIKPMISAIDENTMNKIIDDVINNPAGNIIVDNLIKKLDPDIITKIEEEIRKELSGT